jgi:predicted nuclease with TOPRIM domain
LNLANPTETNASISQSKSNGDIADLQEKVRQAETIQLENERLRSELDAHKKQITVLSGERDSLIETISKLNVELTPAEQQPTGKK